MKTNEGGSMASMVLFGVAMVAFIAAAVLYLVKDETFSKRWAEQTKEVVAANDKLKAEWQDALDTVKGLCANHNTLAEELTRQKEQLAKLEFAVTLPAKPLTLPSTINFTVVERRKVLQPKPVDDRGTLKGTIIQQPKPDATTLKVIKKVKKQMKELSQ